MAREKGVLKFQAYKKEVVFYTTKEKTEYDTLDDFLYSAREAEIYMSFNELNALNQYLDSNIYFIFWMFFLLNFDKFIYRSNNRL